MRFLAWTAAFLAGAAGLALETILIGASGACLGYASSAAIGLAAFLAAWALGAWCAARVERPRPGLVVAVGVAQAASGVLGTWAVLRAGGAGASFALAASVALAAIGTVAFLQGLLLPWIALGEAGAAPRARRDLAGTLGANLLGAAFGAHFVAGELLGHHGRLVSAAAAGALAFAAALLAARIVRGAPTRASSESGSPRAGQRASVRATEAEAERAVALGPGAAALIVGLACAWTATNEWIALRLCALWLGGMEPALRSGLVAALAALALGALVLPRVLPRGRRGVLFALLLAALGSLWPALLARVVPAAAAPSDAARALGLAFAITAPPLVALGALVPLVHRALPEPTAAALGRLLLHEAWGAGIGIPLVHFVLVPAGGLGLAAAFGAAAGACAVIAAARGAPGGAAFGVRGLGALAFLACALVGACLATAPPFSRAAPAYRDPALTLLALREDREFAVAVVEDGLRGERTLFTDGFRAAGTGREYRYMQVLGHLPMLLHAAPKRVAVLALGTGTTLGAVAEHPEVERIDVLEIARAVVEAAPWFEAKNHGVIEREPERVRVLLGDGRRTLADRPDTYDVITMEPLLPDSPFGVYLYTREFYAQARRALREHGIVCQWVPPHALEPSTFRAVLATFGSAFPWSGVWLAGTQVVLLGAAEEPALLPERFPASGALRDRLAALGLDTPAGVVARWSGPPPLDAGERGLLLGDEHPWIVYRPRRVGAVLLGDLPDNLACLRAARASVPERWRAAAGERAPALRAGIEALHRARELHASEEARQRGLPRADASGALREALERARRSAHGDPELAEFEEELEFLASIRRGVSTLVEGDAHAAQLALERAAELRPERADVALYLAVARERAGDPDADAALRRAGALCPRLAETAEGLRARGLGLSEKAWSWLVAAGARAR